MDSDPVCETCGDMMVLLDGRLMCATCTARANNPSGKEELLRRVTLREKDPGLRLTFREMEHIAECQKSNCPDCPMRAYAYLIKIYIKDGKVIDVKNVPDDCDFEVLSVA
jgi:DNA-directed RNA polymerase subunit M/transcription elongation factor TFIIS